MTPRRPKIGGVAGGVGTSVVAALIGGEDIGVVSAGDAVDVLVCRSVSSQVALATRLAAAAPVAPVVVINADCGNRPPHQVRERARMLEPNVPSLLRLPWIEQARSMGDPPAGLRAAAIADTPDPWARDLRQFRGQLITEVTALVLASPPPESSSPPDEEEQPLRRTS